MAYIVSSILRRRDKNRLELALHSTSYSKPCSAALSTTGSCYDGNYCDDGDGDGGNDYHGCNSEEIAMMT